MEENTEEEIVFFQVSDIKTRIISLAVAVYSFLGPIGVIAAIFDILPAYVYTYATHTSSTKVHVSNIINAASIILYVVGYCKIFKKLKRMKILNNAGVHKLERIICLLNTATIVPVQVVITALPLVEYFGVTRFFMFLLFSIVKCFPVAYMIVIPDPDSLLFKLLFAYFWGIGSMDFVSFNNMKTNLEISITRVIT